MGGTCGSKVPQQQFQLELVKLTNNQLQIESSWIHQHNHYNKFIDGNDDAPITKQKANDNNNSWSSTKVRLLLAICWKRMWQK